MKNINLKKIIPHIVAITTFIILAYTYFSPVLEGYTIKQGDIESFKGMSKEIVDFRENFDEEPLWTGTLFSGMPAYQVSTKYHSNIIKTIEDPLNILNHPVKLVMIAFIGFYILLLSLKVNPYLAIIGSIAFCFSSYNFIILEAGHNSKLHAISLMPLLFAGLILILKDKRWKGFIFLSIGASLIFYANHLQITYYTLLALAILGIAYFAQMMKEKKYKTFFINTAISITAIFIGFLTNFATVYNTYSYGKDTMRGTSELTINADGASNQQRSTGLDIDYITNWSQGISESWTFLVPGLKGGATSAVTLPSGQQVNSYFGDQPFTSGPIYFGALICFLAILSFVYIKGWLKWGLLSACILMLLLSWGKNFMPLTEFFVHNFPFYNKFRTVSMTLVILQFVFPFMSIYFLYSIIKDKTIITENIKPFYYISASFMLLLVVMAISPTLFTNLMSNEESKQISEYLKDPRATQQVNEYVKQLTNFRSANVSSDALRSLFIILIGFISILSFIKGKIHQNILFIVLGLVIVIDLWSVNKRYLNNETDNKGNYVSWVERDVYNGTIKASNADKSILQLEESQNPILSTKITHKIDSLKKDKINNDLDDIRVKGFEKENIQFEVLNFNTNFRVLNLATNTFNDAKTSYFHKSIGGYHAAKLGKYQEIIDFYLAKEINELRGGENLNELSLINTLNTKYIIYNPNQAPITNPYHYGNAWLVSSIEFVTSANEEILKIGEVNLKESAVTQSSNKGKITKTENLNTIGYLNQSVFLPNYLKYDVNVNDESFAVFSEIYFKNGWKAYIDGKIEDIIPVDYILRGLNIPKGKHKIEFKFEPSSYKTGNIIGYSSSVILMILLVFYLWKKNNN